MQLHWNFRPRPRVVVQHRVEGQAPNGSVYCARCGRRLVDVVTPVVVGPRVFEVSFTVKPGHLYELPNGGCVERVKGVCFIYGCRPADPMGLFLDGHQLKGAKPAGTPSGGAGKGVA